MRLAVLITISFVVVLGFAAFANWRQTYKTVVLQADNQQAEIARREMMMSLAQSQSKYISP